MTGSEMQGLMLKNFFMRNTSVLVKAFLLFKSSTPMAAIMTSWFIGKDGKEAVRLKLQQDFIEILL